MNFSAYLHAFACVFCDTQACLRRTGHVDLPWYGPHAPPSLSSSTGSSLLETDLTFPFRSFSKDGSIRFGDWKVFCRSIRGFTSETDVGVRHGRGATRRAREWCVRTMQDGQI